MIFRTTIFTLASLFAATAAYDIRCVYPEKWTQNLFSALQFDGYFKTFMRAYSVETPVVIRSSHHATNCRGMCLSLHDPHVLDPFDKQPTWTVPEFGQNGFSTVMCIGQCILHVMDGVFDFVEAAIVEFEENMGLEYTHPSTRPDIAEAWEVYERTGNDAMMMNIMEIEDYHPYTMGHIAGVFVAKHANADGWNFKGEMTYDYEAKMAVPCTGSCRQFQDTVGYKPVLDPRVHTDTSTDESKYECTGTCRRWQPLQEGTDSGSLKRQEFITPHIGEKAKTYLRESTLTLEDPEYDIYQESLDVIERVKEASSNTFQQDAIRFYDDKLRVRGTITNNLRKSFSQDRKLHSFQDEILSLIGISTVEYDGVVQAWHEKLKHDLVRPTTVIKHWGDDDLYTYGGDDELGGPVNIKARDFEAYIRVMPHPEFPSGSSCLCTGYAEFTDIYLQNEYGDTLKDLSWSENGNSYVIADMEQLAYECGASRIWGGMHYPAAIQGGIDICTGLGELAYDYVTELKNGATFDNAWYYGDELGECPNRSTE